MLRTVTAIVRNGKLFVDEPTNLPEGSVVELQVVEEALDDEQRAALDRSLERGVDEALRGEGRPAADVLREMRARRQ